MHSRAPTWFASVADLGHALGSSGDPLTVLLGAGASLSSGAPSTAQVETVWAEAVSRVPAEAQHEYLHLSNMRDRVAALAPLFARLTPFVGYRHLAWLARTRRVLVLNLNWDPLVRLAADALDVPVITYDLRDQGKWREAERLPVNRGIVDVHLHGLFPESLRFGAAETMGFDATEIQHLVELHGGARRLYLGASLEQAHDVIDLLRHLDDGHVCTLTALFQDAPTSEHARTVHASMLGNAPIVLHSSDVDFDMVMLVLGDAVSGDSWERERKSRTQLPLPKLKQLVLPDAPMLGPALDARAVLLLGDARLGKTTAAYLLAYLWQMWSTDGESVIRPFDGPGSTVAALGGGHDESTQHVHILENPFGEGADRRRNPLFAEALREAAGREGPRLVVTSRFGDWPVDIAVPTSPIWVPEGSPRVWYSGTALRHLAERISRPGQELVAEVGLGRLDTPARVVDRAHGLEVGSAIERTADAIASRTRPLIEIPEFGQLCFLARLQELGGEPLPVSDLYAIAGTDASTVAAAGTMLHRYSWEGAQRLRLATAVDAEAVDVYAAAREEELCEFVDQPGAHPALRDGLDAWRILRLARERHWLELEGWAPDRLAEHACSILDAAPSAEALTLVSGLPLDEWQLSEMAQSLVRLWEELPHAERDLLLREMLGNRASNGAYGVLEACLYFGQTAHPSLRAEVAARTWRLSETGADWEVALCLDGYAWRFPADGSADVVRWAREQVRRRTPAVSATLRLAAVYHPGGLRSLDLEDEGAELVASTCRGEESELLGRLVRWHFLHQSRARAHLARQLAWIDKTYLCRTTHPVGDGADQAAIRSLMQALREAGQAGWAYFVYRFLLCTFTVELDERTEHLVQACIRDASPDDSGMAFATITFPADDTHQQQLRACFSDPLARDLLLDALSGKLEIDGYAVAPPRFDFAFMSAATLRMLNITFPRLEQYGNGVELAGRLLEELIAAVTSRRIARGTAAELRRRITRGDLRPFDDAAAARGGAATISGIVLRAASVIEAGQG